MRAVARAGELLRQGQKVIIYDCGGDAALLALSGLDGHFGLRPTALSDSSPVLWGKKLDGMSIISPRDAAEQFPDAWWLVTNFLNRAAGIQFLIGLGIIPEKIINYVPYERRTSCRYLENYLHTDDTGLCFCCDAIGRATPPRIEATASANVEQLVLIENQLRQNTIQQLGNGTSCDFCSDMKESFFPKARKIEMINFGGGICNFQCCYCIASAKNKPKLQNGLDFVQVFSAYNQAGMLSEDIHVQFNSGEIGVHPKRAEMFHALGDATVSVLTNSSVYVPEIAEKLRFGDAIVNTSLDAGTRGTFRRVKGTDAWERVCDNLRRYAAIRKSSIVLKYIFLPGINDTPAEIDGFLQICKETAGAVQLSSEIYHPERITGATRRAFQYMRESLEQEGILYRISAGAFSDRK